MLQWLEGAQTLITCSKDKSIKFWKLPPVWVDEVAVNPNKETPQRDTFLENEKRPGDLTGGYKLTDAKEYYEKQEESSKKPIGNIGHLLVKNEQSDEEESERERLQRIEAQKKAEEKKTKLV